MKTARMLVGFVLGAMIFGNGIDAVASPPVEGEAPEIVKNGFVPRAGYGRTALAAHLAKRAVERNALLFAPGQALSVSGTRALPVICVEFSNVSAPFTVAQYQELLFGQNPLSMSRYYNDISQQRFSVTGQVVGWYKAPKTDTFYEDGQQGGGAPFGEMLEFALKKADADLDFGQFDNDGPDGNPNSGDDDGQVDTVFFIHPEHGAECDRGPNIWSHSWHYSEPTFGHSAPFESQDIRRDTNGNPVLKPNGTPQHILVEDYTIQPAQACGSTAGNRKIIEIGVFCHEYGHALGLPDFYDRTPSGNPDSAGIGNWCLMAGGSYGGDGDHPERPTRMSAWCKYYLGWGSLQTLEQNGQQDFPPVRESNEMFRLVVPNTQNLEYFLLEYRRNGSGAGGQINWDEFLPSSGLAVWHVDERVGGASPNWPFAGADQGQNDSPVRLNSAPPPLFRAKHPLVALVQSDGNMELERPAGGRGDAGDLFQSGDLQDDPSGRAGTRAFNGQATGIAVTQIQVTPNQIAGQVAVAQGSTPLAPALAAAPPFGAAVDSNLSESLKNINSKLQPHLKDQIDSEAFAKTLDDDERRIIEDVSSASVFRVLPSDAAQAVVEIGSQLRSLTVSAESETESKVEEAVQNLVRKCEQPAPATIRYVPGRASAAQVTGLQLKAGKPTTGEDAQARVTEDADLKTALGLEENLVSITADKNSSLQQFLQTEAVDDQQLPIFDSTVSLYYDNARQLVAVAARPTPGITEVVGSTASLDENEALKSAADALGLPAEAFRDGAQKGIYVGPSTQEETTQQGRVAYRLEVSIGEYRKPLEIFVDAESKKVLEIR